MRKSVAGCCTGVDASMIGCSLLTEHYVTGLPSVHVRCCSWKRSVAVSRRHTASCTLSCVLPLIDGAQVHISCHDDLLTHGQLAASVSGDQTRWYPKALTRLRNWRANCKWSPLEIQFLHFNRSRRHTWFLDNMITSSINVPQIDPLTTTLRPPTFPPLHKRTRLA